MSALSSLQDILQSATLTPFLTYHSFFRFLLSALFFALVSGLGAMLCDISLSAGRNYELAIMRLAPNCRSINNSNENKTLSLV